MRRECQTEIEFLKFAAQVARLLQPGLIIFLQGQLGAGKTTFTRGVLRELGFQEKVKSPTYTLVEQYEFPKFTFYHFDLYRLADPQELEHIGIKEYFLPTSICMIEWPEKGAGLLPQPDLTCYIDFMKTGRSLTFTAESPLGKTILKNLEQFPPLSGDE